MLGEIFGRNAGLTCTELWLLRFLGSRLFNLDSPRLLIPVPVGEAIEPSWGLGKADPVALMGALAAPSLGIFLVAFVELVCSMFASEVLIGLRAGFLVVLAGSGKTMSSMICSMSASAAAVCSCKFEVCRVPPLIFLLCLRTLMSDAGVAGSPLTSCADASGGCPCLASRYGDLPAELDLGVAGGGIKTSDNGSGETESGPELSWLYGIGSLPSLLWADFDFRASSMMPETSFAGMTVLEGCFFLCGFIAGDCLTARAGFFVELDDVFLLDLRRGAGVVAEGSVE